MRVTLELEVQDYDRRGAAELAKRLTKVAAKLLQQGSVVPVIDVPGVEMSLEVDLRMRCVNPGVEAFVRLAERKAFERDAVTIPLPVWPEE